MDGGGSLELLSANRILPVSPRSPNSSDSASRVILKSTAQRRGLLTVDRFSCTLLQKKDKIEMTTMKSSESDNTNSAMSRMVLTAVYADTQSFADRFPVSNFFSASKLKIGRCMNIIRNFSREITKFYFTYISRGNFRDGL